MNLSLKYGFICKFFILLVFKCEISIKEQRWEREPLIIMDFNWIFLRTPIIFTWQNNQYQLRYFCQMFSCTFLLILYTYHFFTIKTI